VAGRENYTYILRELL